MEATSIGCRSPVVSNLRAQPPECPMLYIKDGMIVLSLRILMGEVIKGNLIFRELVLYGKNLKLSLKVEFLFPFCTSS